MAPASGKLDEYHVFLASPGDCLAERKEVRAYFEETNRTFGRLLGFRLELLGWDTHADTGAGRPQARINRQTLERHKDSLILVVGLMAQRFGVPSGEADSGTQEEYEWAVERRRCNGGLPEIKWFFRTIERFESEPRNESIQEAFDQWKKVQEFRKRLEDSKELWYAAYNGAGAFRDAFSKDLQAWITDPERPWNARSAQAGRESGLPPFQPSRLVLPPPDFTGRAKEIDAIVHALSDPSQRAVVLIHGMPGAGKTTLARAAARDARLDGRFTGGEYRLDLRGLDRNPPGREELLRSLLPQLGASPELPAGALLETYHALLAERATLILADNAGGEGQLQGLEPKPPSALLVTSRREIPLARATRVRLSNWGGEERVTAVRMLQAAIGAGRKQHLTDQEADAVAHACGYLPVAVRAAASLLTVPKYQDVALLLDDLAAKRATLRDDDTGEEIQASLRLSVDALETREPELAAAWRRLAVFPEDFDTAAAASVAGLSDSEVHGALGRLMGDSLIEQVADEDRYRLHDLYRSFAIGSLAPDVRQAAELAHAVYFGKWVAACAERFEQKGGQTEALAALDRERANVEAGWAAANALGERKEEAGRALLDFGACKPQLLYIRLTARVLADWAGAAVEAARRLREPKAEARAWGNLGAAYDSLGEYRKAIEHHEKHLELAHTIEDPAGEATAYGNLGAAYDSLGEYRKAIEHQEKHLELARALEDRAGESRAYGNLGVAYNSLGEYRKAIEHHEKHLELAQTLEDRAGEAMALWNRGVALRSDGQLEAAIASSEEGLNLARRLEMPWDEQYDAALSRWKAERDRQS